MSKPGLRLLGTNSADTIISARGATRRVVSAYGVSGDGAIEGVTLTGGSWTDPVTLVKALDCQALAAVGLAIESRCVGAWRGLSSTAEIGE